MRSILLVEDDKEITKLIDLHLNTDSYRLTTCDSGEEAIRRTATEEFHLLILDVMLPGLNGLEVCKKLRERKDNVPIMMLTSLAEETDKIMALELGADEYITKPFGILELIARTKALLRRAAHHRPNESEPAGEIVCKDLRIDKHKRKTTFSDKRLDLTPKEFDLLYLLASNPGKSFTRAELLKEVWGSAFAGYEHTVTAHVNRLRIKIESDLHHPAYILTSWGTGYRFTE